MKSYGPFVLQPYIDSSLGASANSMQIPIQVGVGGYIEVINLSDYLIQLTFQSQGSVFQESNSKVLYRAVEALGTQVVQVIVPKYMLSQFNPAQSFPETQSASGQLHNMLFLNVYEAGEIDPYSPVSLQAMNPKRIAQVNISGNFTTTQTLTIPDTFTAFGAPVSVCYCLGFDFTAGAPTAATTSVLTISNIEGFDGGATQMFYVFAAFPTTTYAPVSIRFAQPLVNRPIFNPTTGTDAPLTFSLTATQATTALNVYYYLI